MRLPTASPSWTPGDEELEQAALAISLLARLPGALRSHDALLQAGPAGAAAAAAAAAGPAPGSLAGLRDDMWQLWQALAGHDRDGAAAGGILVGWLCRGAGYMVIAPFSWIWLSRFACFCARRSTVAGGMGNKGVCADLLVHLGGGFSVFNSNSTQHWACGVEGSKSTVILAQRRRARGVPNLLPASPAHAVRTHSNTPSNKVGVSWGLLALLADSLVAVQQQYPGGCRVRCAD